MASPALQDLIQKAQYDFIGGLALPGFKDLSLGNTEQPIPIVDAPVPKRLAIPLSQHIGASATPCVEVGDRVLRGQRIAKPDGYISAPTHASSSGTVVAIHNHPVPHPSGLTAPCVIIETDGLDEAVPVQYVEDYNIMDASHLRNVIRNAGIVGLGGAAFPTNVKLNPGPDKSVATLILNGAECEPYITCDAALMRYRAAHIVAGIDIMQKALNADQVLIGIGDTQHEEAAQLAAALEKAGRQDTQIVMVPTRYPKGGEKQLIQALTGQEVPKDGLPIDIGIVCQNIATAAAIYRAVSLGEPLVSRLVTVTGPGIKTPQNVRTRIGTPVRDLIEFCGGYTPAVERLIMGGPMMGYALHNDQVPVVKSTNCILAAGKADLPDYSQEMPCIRCGSCADVCPASLLPQQLYWHTKAEAFDKVQEYQLFDCIECGCCSAVCPSQIPLVQYYRHAKGEIWKQEAEQRKADKARERHESRVARIEREEQEKAARQAARKAALKPKASATDGNADTNSKQASPAQAAIAAAIARAKAKKTAEQATEPATKNSASTDNSTAAEPSTLSPAQAAIERAKSKSNQAKPNTDANNRANNNAPLSPAQAAIAKAQAKTKQPASTETASGTATPNKSNAPNTTEQDETPTLSPAQIAIAKAKQKAQENAQDSAQDSGQEKKQEKTSAEKQTKETSFPAASSQETSNAPASQSLSPAQLAIAKAKAKANANKAPATPTEAPSNNTSNAPTLSPAQLAIAKAKAAARQNAADHDKD